MYLRRTTPLFGPTVLMLLSLICLSLLSACAQMGVPTPQTVNEKIAVGIATVTSVRATATTLVAANKISADDAENVQKQADTARDGLTVARSLSGKDPLSADNKVESVTLVLKALQAYLLKQQQQPPK